MFIGSVSGGIWRTTDGGNHWDPLTDNQSSLAISTLALSPLDSLGNPVTGTTPLNHFVLVAGTGDQSSAAGGGAATGLLFSNDGGTTWVPIGATQLDDLRVTRVLPTTLQHGFDQVIYVSTYDKDVDGTAGFRRQGRCIPPRHRHRFVGVNHQAQQCGADQGVGFRRLQPARRQLHGSRF